MCPLLKSAEENHDDAGNVPARVAVETPLPSRLAALGLNELRYGVRLEDEAPVLGRLLVAEGRLVYLATSAALTSEEPGQGRA